jgi:2-keto-4-pentenoate hydratase/2-oxohepta-3-ene-1,7-dioic acid hydratase in catechol pathway
MKYCRFEYQNTARYGLIESVGGHEAVVALFLDSPWGNCDRRQELSPLPLEQAVLLAPIQPSKIVCVGRNYREHAAELGHDVPREPLIFLKPPSALLPPGGTILRPKISSRVDHEGELGVVIGKRCRNLRADEDVRSHILGYTCVNDVTARDLQNKESQWARAKGCDTFCPVGPAVTDVLDPWQGTTVETRVNGELRQSGNTANFIFPLDIIIRYVADAMTLFPGDLIATGTPKGVGPLTAGDMVEVTVAGVGTLRNRVEDGC